MNKLINKKNRLTCTLFVISLLMLTRCKNNDPSPDANAAYIRVINAFPSDGNFDSDFGYSMFYMDGYLNGNPTKINPADFATGGIREGEDTILFRGFDISFLDIKSTFQPGLYNGGQVPAASRINPGGPANFPNITNQVNLAPIINDIDFYKWAQVTAGSHDIAFNHILNNPGNVLFTNKRDTLVKTTHFFEKGSVYTLLLAKTGLGPKDFNVVSIKEPINKTFEPQKAYLRFLNFVHKRVEDQKFTQSTSSIDVYYTKTIKDRVTNKETTTPQIPIALNLLRFNVSEDQTDFAEIDMSDLFALNRDSVIVGNYNPPVFNFYFYKSGESAANGSTPISSIGSGHIKHFDPHPISPLYLVSPGGPQTTITTVAIDIVPDAYTSVYTVIPLTYNLERKNTTDAYYK